MAWDLDPNHLSVSFSAKHLGVATVRGFFRRADAEIELDDPNDPTTARGTVRIDTASLDTGNEQRDGHLRGADFFDVETYPSITFTARSIDRRGDGTYAVAGDLTIRDVTRPVELEYEHGGVVTDPFGNTKTGGTLTGRINRSDWGLRWNVPLGQGGVLVSDAIKLEVDGQLAQTKDAVEAAAAAESAARA